MRGLITYVIELIVMTQFAREMLDGSDRCELIIVNANYIVIDHDDDDGWFDTAYFLDPAGNPDDAWVIPRCRGV